MIKEFREFISRGNVIDLAVGIIIGAAFTAIVNSLVNDVVMPVIGLATAGIDFSQIAITLREAQGENPAVVIAVGKFINAIIQFLIVALVVFMLVRAVNRLKRPTPQSAPTLKDCPYCMSTININATRCPNCTSELKAA